LKRKIPGMKRRELYGRTCDRSRYFGNPSDEGAVFRGFSVRADD